MTSTRLGLDLRLGVPATGLDLDGRAVHLADGSVVPFDGVVLATGSTPRRPPRPGRRADGPRAAHARRLAAPAAASPTAPPASSSSAPGSSASRSPPRARSGLHRDRARGAAGAADPRASAPRWATRRRRARRRGHEIRLRRERRRAASTTACGWPTASVVPADVIVVGIGVAPATGWLDGSGLEIRDGVVCDATLAAGRRASTPPATSPAGRTTLFGEEMRVEHWTNAAEQGAAAARNLLADPPGAAGEPYAPVPFFWSDQGRHRIQFLGRRRRRRRRRVEVVVGDPAEHRFLALYGRHGQLWGVLGVNLPAAGDAVPQLLADRPARAGTTRGTGAAEQPSKPESPRAQASSRSIPFESSMTHERSDRAPAPARPPAPTSSASPGRPARHRPARRRDHARPRHRAAPPRRRGRP